MAYNEENKKELFERLEEYSKSDIYPFCMPGHKRILKVSGAEQAYALDITEVEGFDDLHRANGILKDITDEAEKLYGVPHAFMSVNGSTACNLAAANCIPDDGALLVAANCHCSVFNGAKLSGREVIEIAPAWVPLTATYGAISPAEVKNAFRGYPKIKAFILTSPSYEGFVSDIKSIADVVHAHNAYLIVDEAHGAHLPFCKKMPESALYLGADIVVHSLHKTLGSLNQTAMAFVNNENLAESFAEKLLMFTTTSPSYILMASIHHAIRNAAQHPECFESYYELLCKTRNRLSQNKNIGIVDNDIIGRYNIFGLDTAKIMLIPKNISGNELYFRLLDDFSLQLEKHDEKYAMAMTSFADTACGFERLAKAARKIDFEIEHSLRG